jgi:hypothetical protein
MPAEVASTSLEHTSKTRRDHVPFVVFAATLNRAFF